MADGEREAQGPQAPPPEAPVPGGQPPETSSAEVVESVAAALRADTTDLDTYHRVLSSTIGSLLPSGMVEVDYERTLSDRMAGRKGRARTITLRLGEATLQLESGHGRIVATVAKEVRGVTISRREVQVDEWVRELAATLVNAAADSSNARDALAKLLGQG